MRQTNYIMQGNPVHWRANSRLTFKVALASVISVKSKFLKPNNIPLPALGHLQGTAKSHGADFEAGLSGMINPDFP